jgi:molybdopterin/thiamine biosynthesis adenylyltransferase
MTFREDQIRRYARHVLLPDVGGTGQRRLLGGAVVIDSLDGATEAALTYLAGAGVGTIVVRDEGAVTAPGFLFETADVGRPRLEAARERIARLNPDVRVVASGDGVPLPACADLEAAARAALAAVRTLLCAS